MLIGELASRSGFSRDTIRFYEKQGLIQVTQKDRRDNNYKEYSEETLQNLITIKRLKEFGFTLYEATEFLDLIKSNAASCDSVEEKINEKILEIDKKITELQHIRSLLVNEVAACLIRNKSVAEKDNCRILLPDNT